MSIHKFRASIAAPTFCQCGQHHMHAVHRLLDPDALPDLVDACQRIIRETRSGEVTIGAIEDCQAALRKAEGA